ncbi:MAG: 23S rRNA (adenine(2503)-C(2))-methyltransferase RlmN [Phycisphaerales bacterium]|nr:23S rRNA (adenine(2503)-C(2))-methyltransferase RlmN [Phycisphaerales bacterium]
MSTHFFDLDRDGLAQLASEHGFRSFLPKQLLRWVYEQGITDPERMTDLSKRDRERLPDVLDFERSVELTHQLATDGTQKLLMGWPDVEPGPGLNILQSGGDDRETECVMIPTEKRRTACISSQVGCPVGCRFCASGLGGLEGNLTAGQIVEQAWRLGRLDQVDRITNIVFMGMGEPLANYANVTRAIRILNAEWGLGIGARRITVSTVGMPVAIRKLAEFELPVTLALSLHAPFDELRRDIIPWAEHATIRELLDACNDYFQATGREITLEYILLGKLNDQVEHAQELARLARTLRANVNLIRYNEVAGLPFERPVSADVHRFQAILKDKGVNAHIRASRGRDIAAACGQLRHEQRQARVDDECGANGQED